MKPNFKLKNLSGVYQIRNTVNGKVYIGRTKCFYKRCHQYIYDFRERTIGHINDYLYRAMSKYGIENFSFEVLEYCPVHLTPDREFYWIISSESNDRRKGYNIRLDVAGKMLTSPETSIRISSRLKKEWSEGVRGNHSDKIKASWHNRDRNAQSNLMSKNLTKYEYHVSTLNSDIIILNYKQLRDIGLKCSLVSFWKNNSDIVTVKGCRVERKRVVN